jgi:hypothetical protein
MGSSGAVAARLEIDTALARNGATMPSPAPGRRARIG